MAPPSNWGLDMSGALGGRAARGELWCRLARRAVQQPCRTGVEQHGCDQVACQYANTDWRREVREWRPPHQEATLLHVLIVLEGQTYLARLDTSRGNVSLLKSVAPREGRGLPQFSVMMQTDGRGVLMPVGVAGPSGLGAGISIGAARAAEGMVVTISRGESGPGGQGSVSGTPGTGPAADGDAGCDLGLGHGETGFSMDGNAGTAPESGAPGSADLGAGDMGGGF